MKDLSSNVKPYHGKKVVELTTLSYEEISPGRKASRLFQVNAPVCHVPPLKKKALFVRQKVDRENHVPGLKIEARILHVCVLCAKILALNSNSDGWLNGSYCYRFDL